MFLNICICRHLNYIAINRQKQYVNIFKNRLHSWINQLKKLKLFLTIYCVCDLITLVSLLCSVCAWATILQKLSNSISRVLSYTQKYPVICLKGHSNNTWHFFGPFLTPVSPHQVALHFFSLIWFRCLRLWNTKERKCPWKPLLTFLKMDFYFQKH